MIAILMNTPFETVNKIKSENFMNTKIDKNEKLSKMLSFPSSAISYQTSRKHYILIYLKVEYSKLVKL